jgi:glycosyltransferase involved in cell wall biosynthesis
MRSNRCLETKFCSLQVGQELIGAAYHPVLKRLLKVVQKLDPEAKFIHYCGPISYLELPKIYHRAAGFVFASSCENMPNILLEAMSSRLPIAWSERGPMPKVLGEGGIYFDPERVESIVSALCNLVQDVTLCEHWARLAYTNAQNNSWDYCAWETLKFLVQTANGWALTSSPVQ